MHNFNNVINIIAEIKFVPLNSQCLPSHIRIVISPKSTGYKEVIPVAIFIKIKVLSQLLMFPYDYQ